jgi:hypothetical protein
MAKGPEAGVAESMIIVIMFFGREKNFLEMVAWFPRWDAQLCAPVLTRIVDAPAPGDPGSALGVQNRFYCRGQPSYRAPGNQAIITLLDGIGSAVGNHSQLGRTSAVAVHNCHLL